MTTPATFARLAAVHGTAAAVTDPHEIANVRGAAGIRAFVEASEGLPVEVLVMLPSCVPSTHLETSGQYWALRTSNRSMASRGSSASRR